VGDVSMKEISITKRIKKTERHVRFNWEISPENSKLVRYHFIVADDKNRKGIMNKIIEPLQKYDYIELIRNRIFDIKDSKNKALFNSYDTPIKPEFLELHKIRKQIVRDYNLYERKRGSLDEYVADFFYKHTDSEKS
jgi:hypothetical protein